MTERTNPEYTKVLFQENRFVQGAELKEVQGIIARRNARTANLVARDGDRIAGADIIVNQSAGTVTLTAGKVFLKGDVRDVPTTVLTAVPMTGEVSIGVRLTSGIITYLEVPNLLGQEEGTAAEGEPGADRETETVAWSREGDNLPGVLYQVYLLKDGVAIDQTPPPQISGVNAAIAQYDRGAHGHYVVSGCEVSALGLSAGKQVFSIAKGEANINGFKFTRYHDLRHEEPEAADTDEVEAESRQYTPAGASVVFNVYHAPIASVISVSVEKEKTVTVTKGALPGSQDALPDNSVISLVEVKQGVTTYVTGTDYLLTADKVDWSPSGAEPAGGSSYTVKYRYYDNVAAGTGYTFTPTAITVFGGVLNGNVILRYLYKLPRRDIICLNDRGMTVYIKGESARQNPASPITPTQLLKLADIINDWQNKPQVVMHQIAKSITYERFAKLIEFFFETRDLVNIALTKQELDRKESLAKLGSFIDPLVDNSCRDQGVAQTAAVFGGQMRHAIEPITAHDFPMAGPLMLDWTHEIVVRQELVSFCAKINPYQNFEVLPGELSLSPATDSWVQFDTQWLSAITRTVVGGASSTTEQLVSERTELLPLLRQIPVAFTIRGFAANEQLATLTFDGINVKPPGTQTANAQGVITGSFTIPANVSAGSKLVRATGSADTAAAATFVGQGRVEIDVMRRVNTVAVQPPSGILAGGDDNNNPDPIAQTFTLTEGRFISGVDLKFCFKGSVSNGVIVELVTVENGVPTRDVLNQVSIDMGVVVLNQWHPCNFAVPVFVPANRETAFVIKTDDANHSVYCARVGDADMVTGKSIGAQPYSVGVMHTSSNASSWTPHQNEDVAFRLKAAKFSPTTKTFNFGSVSVVSMSDVLIPAALALASETDRLHFELERQNGTVIRLAPGQYMALTEYITETLQFRAVLQGSEKSSPVLYPDLKLIAGSMRAQANYVTTAFKMGTNVKVNAYFKAFIPSGSTLTLECDAANNTWVAMTMVEQEPLAEPGWYQMRFEKTGYTATLGRIRATMNGGPAARGLIEQFSGYVV